MPKSLVQQRRVEGALGGEDVEINRLAPVPCESADKG
jgi:hypothetical protein